VQAGGNVTILPSHGPVTIRMRYARAAGSDTVTAQYRVIAPASAANADWVNFPGAANFLDLNPSSGSRRDASGSRIGLYAGGNFPGTSGAHPYTGTPAKMVVDYFRTTAVSPCEGEDVAPPVTTATLDPAVPGSGPVDVTLSATDGDDENASGVARAEYSVDGGAWQQAENAAGDDPFTTTVTVKGAGDHTVAYRSRDEAGNLEPAKTTEFTIQAPSRDVFAQGTTWNPDALTIPFGETVTWHFDEPDAGFPHDVWVVPPGGQASQVTSGPVSPGGAPVSFTFRKAGAWTFFCSIHAGMDGTIDVGADTTPPPGGGGGGGGGTPPPGPGGNPLPSPNPQTPTAARLDRLPKTTLATFLKRGVRIRSRCESGLTGTVKLLLARKTARKLGLRKQTTLVSKRVRCGGNDRVAVTLKVNRRVKRALRKSRRSLALTVRIQMGSGAAKTTNSRRLVLKVPR
jgi:plastocyanin